MNDVINYLKEKGIDARDFLDRLTRGLTLGDFLKISESFPMILCEEIDGRTVGVRSTDGMNWKLFMTSDDTIIPQIEQ